MVGEAGGDVFVGVGLGAEIFVDPGDAAFSVELEVGFFDPLVADADAGRDAEVEVLDAVFFDAGVAVAVEFFVEEVVVFAGDEPVVSVVEVTPATV